MAITANMTTHDGVALTSAYVRVTSTYVKKMGSDWKLVYDVEIYKDKATRDDEVKEQSMLFYFCYTPIPLPFQLISIVSSGYKYEDINNGSTEFKKEYKYEKSIAYC